MELTDNQAIFAQNVAHLIEYIFVRGHKVTFGEAYRTPEQAELYAKEGKGIAKSLHCQRLAIDLNLFSSDGKYLTEKKEYQPFGDYWKSLHPANRWGGDFSSLVDSNHFEMHT